MISKCNAVGKSVISATQISESMIQFPRPTRVEATTDVSNASLGWFRCSYVVSGETTPSDYPFFFIIS